MNPQSELYNAEVYRTKHLHFDLSSPATTDSSGNPYAFLPQALPGFPMGYFMWFDMSLPMDVAQHRLKYLKDAGFFAARRSNRAQLQFIGVDAARQTIAFTKVSIVWRKGGSITADVTVTGMPAVATSSTLWVCCLGLMHGTVFVSTGADTVCLLYTSPSPRDRTRSRMPSSA